MHLHTHSHSHAHVNEHTHHRVFNEAGKELFTDEAKESQALIDKEDAKIEEVTEEKQSVNDMWSQIAENGMKVKDTDSIKKSNERINDLQ